MSPFMLDRQTSLGFKSSQHIAIICAKVSEVSNWGVLSFNFNSEFKSWSALGVRIDKSVSRAWTVEELDSFPLPLSLESQPFGTSKTSASFWNLQLPQSLSKGSSVTMMNDDVCHEVIQLIFPVSSRLLHWANVKLLGLVRSVHENIHKLSSTALARCFPSLLQAQVCKFLLINENPKLQTRSCSCLA